MTVFDNLLMFSRVQAVTNTANGTDTVDQVVARDLAAGGPVKVLFHVIEAVTSAFGGTTVTFEVLASDLADLSSPVVIGSSAPIPKADLGIGKEVVVRIDDLPTVVKKHVGVRYTCSTALLSGKFTAGVILQHQHPATERPFGSGY